jgi:two-component system response regulator YesN
MEKAKELLKSTDYTISEIAFRVGYGTYEHFNYIFKKHENISARDFRRQQGRTEG